MSHGLSASKNDLLKIFFGVALASSCVSDHTHSCSDGNKFSLSKSGTSARGSALGIDHHHHAGIILGLSGSPRHKSGRVPAMHTAESFTRHKTLPRCDCDFGPACET